MDCELAARKIVKDICRAWIREYAKSKLESFSESLVSLTILLRRSFSIFVADIYAEAMLYGRCRHFFSLWTQWDVATEKARISYSVYIHVICYNRFSYIVFTCARSRYFCARMCSKLKPYYLFILPQRRNFCTPVCCVIFPLDVLGFYQRKVKNKRTKTLLFQSCYIFWIIIDHNFLSLENSYNPWKVWKEHLFQPCVVTLANSRDQIP